MASPLKSANSSECDKPLESKAALCVRKYDVRSNNSFFTFGFFWVVILLGLIGHRLNPHTKDDSECHTVG